MVPVTVNTQAKAAESLTIGRRLAPPIVVIEQEYRQLDFVGAFLPANVRGRTFVTLSKVYGDI
jgi:hypothetical protein